MLKRKMLDKLIAWKQKAGGRESLLIEGARRVGKSTIVEEFGRTQYKSYILIDFTRLPRDVRDIFENQRDDFDTFFMLLSAYYRKRLYERESLIIFDEVQRYPAARELVKYLVADGRYDYVETGSLISIKRNVANIVIPSEERKMDMGPLDFEEFCWAMGEELLAETIRKSFDGPVARCAAQTSDEAVARISAGGRYAAGGCRLCRAARFWRGGFDQAWHPAAVQ